MSNHKPTEKPTASKVKIFVFVSAIILVMWYSCGGDPEEEKKVALTPEQFRMQQIEKGFSGWDGSHIELTKLIKQSMNDPDSYDPDETRYSDNGDHLIVITSFRGKNAFGGVVKNAVKAKCSLDGKVIEVIDLE